MGPRSSVAEGLKVVDIVQGLDLILFTFLNKLDNFFLDPPLAFQLIEFILKPHLGLVKLHLPPDVVLQLQVSDPSCLPQSQIFVLYLKLRLVLLPVAFGELVIDLHPDIVPKLTGLLRSCTIFGP